MADSLAELKGRISGEVFEPGDEGYAPAISCFNTGIVHAPEIAVAAESADDVAEAIRYGAANGLKVSVQGTGHTESQISGGLLISTRRLDKVEVDVASKVATVGAGIKWADLMPVATAAGLTPIVGSSPDVGTVGYLLGGGFGPMVRSHGISSDYLIELTVVTAAGEVVKANADENPDLFRGLRGGKFGLGIVTEVKIQLIELASIYGGSLFFAEEDIEAAFRGWIEWTNTADEKVSTSAAILQFPPFDEVPPPLRGRRLLNIRFVHPDVAEGEGFAAPIRALAPVYLDMLGELPMAQIGMVHNDPTDPKPAWVRGAMFSHADDELASKLLAAAGAGTTSPFVSFEIRHLGSAASTDVPEGSSVGGRSAGYSLVTIGANPLQFEKELPDSFAALLSDIEPWISNDNNVNFLVAPGSVERLSTAWPEETWERLEALRGKYDPDGVFAPFGL